MGTPLAGECIKHIAILSLDTQVKVGQYMTTVPSPLQFTRHGCPVLPPVCRHDLPIAAVSSSDGSGSRA